MLEMLLKILVLGWNGEGCGGVLFRRTLHGRGVRSLVDPCRYHVFYI